MADINSSVKGITGATYQLTKLLGKGGEGSVYETTVPEKVAKIYDASKPGIAARLPELEKKLTYMVMKIPMSVISKATKNVLVPWPQDVLYENGRFVGFLMPKISGAASIQRIHHGNPGASKVVPGYDWKKGALIAENLAKVVKMLHQYNVVIGDMNSGNILVYPNCDVVIVDTDSFDIRAEGNVHYKCKVATETFVPPELQGRNLNDPDAYFTKKTDEFALAVHIFLLLMRNYHPFNVKVLDPSVSSDESKQAYNISAGNCPFLRQIPGCECPVGAPNLRRLLPDVLVNDFAATFNYKLDPKAPDYLERARAIGINRTKAETWYEHLHEFNQNSSGDLIQCSANPEHYFLRSHGACELCKAQDKWQEIVVSHSRTAMPRPASSHSTQLRSANSPRFVSQPQPQPQPRPQPQPQPQIQTQSQSQSQPQAQQQTQQQTQKSGCATFFIYLVWAFVSYLIYYVIYYVISKY